MADLLLLALASAELPDGMVLLDGVIFYLKQDWDQKFIFIDHKGQWYINNFSHCWAGLDVTRRWLTPYASHSVSYKIYFKSLSENLETTIFHTNLEDVPVGNLWHIVLPLEVTSG